MMWEEKVFYIKRDTKEEVYLNQISKKLAKGKNAEQIADEVELTVDEVNELIRLIDNES